MSNEQGPGLKKLDFVPKTAAKGYTIATNAYSSGKEYLPVPVKDSLTRVEQNVTEVAAPYVTKAQDKSTELLKLVDDKVDKAVAGASQMYQHNSEFVLAQLEKQKQLRVANSERFAAAKEHYLKKVEESMTYIKANGFTGAAKMAADEVTHAVTEARKLPGAMVRTVHDAFERLMAFEPVQKALQTTRPAVDAAYSRYMGVHDSVVASWEYKKAYELSVAAVARAQDTFIYRKAKANLYPLVSRYADPALAQLQGSSYYQMAVQHITPPATTA